MWVRAWEETMGLCWHLPVPRWFTGLQCGYPWFIMDVPCVSLYIVFIIYMCILLNTVCFIFTNFQVSHYSILSSLSDVTQNLIWLLNLHWINFQHLLKSTAGLNGRVSRAGATHSESNWNPYQSKFFSHEQFWWNFDIVEINDYYLVAIKYLIQNLLDLIFSDILNNFWLETFFSTRHGFRNIVVLKT